MDHRPCIGDSEDDDACKAKMGHNEAGAFVYYSEYAALQERVRDLEEALSMTICHGCENRIGWNVPHESGLSTGLSSRIVATRTDWAKCPNCKRQRAALKGSDD